MLMLFQQNRILFKEALNSHENNRVLRRGGGKTYKIIYISNRPGWSFQSRPRQIPDFGRGFQHKIGQNKKNIYCYIAIYKFRLFKL